MKNVTVVEVNLQLVEVYRSHVVRDNGWPILPTGLVTIYGAVAGRLWTTLSTVLISQPVIFIFLDPGWQAIHSRWLLTLDTNFFYARMQTMVP
jgi:hypothetical protein